MRIAATLVLLSAPVILLAQASSSDFARGADIRTEGGDSIFRVVLPDDVYATVAHPDFADIRVLNAAGEAVPHRLRETPQPPHQEAAWRTVPSFPMTEAQAGAGARTHVRIGADGTVLEVTNDTSLGKATMSYLVDASSLKAPVARMSLSWETAPSETFLARVSVLRSDDLAHWQTIVSSAALAQLQRDSYTVTRNEIELPASGERAKYFRISWPNELAKVMLKSVQLRPPTTVVPREMRWKTLVAERVETLGTAEFDARAILPIEYVDLEFHDANDVASVTVRSRSTSSSSWTQRHSGVFYSLQQSNTAVRSSEARIGPTTDRYWSIQSIGKEGWTLDRAPRLKVGWHPHELLFLAQGSAPYTLVYGSARVGSAEAPVDVVLTGLDAEQADRVRLATVGEPRTFAGADALKPAPPLRRIALWGVLVVAVAMLAFLAMGLFRDTAQTR